MRLVETGWLGECHPLHPPHPKIFAKTNFSSFRFRAQRCTIFRTLSNI